MMQPPGNAPGMVGLQVCYCGPQADAEKALAPIRKLGTPLRGHDQSDGLRAGAAVRRFDRHARASPRISRAASSARCRASWSRRWSMASKAIRVARRSCSSSTAAAQPGACAGERDGVRASLRDRQHDDRGRLARRATRTRRRTSRRRAATGRRSSRSRAASTSTTWRAKSPRRTSTRTIAATTSGWSRSRGSTTRPTCSA